LDDAVLGLNNFDLDALSQGLSQTLNLFTRRDISRANHSNSTGVQETEWGRAGRGQ
jgi:hypothetical protein